MMIAASQVASPGDASSKPDVLLLHSYHPEFPWTDGVTKGVRNALGEQIDPEGLRLEHMDARRHMDDPKFSQLTLSYLHQKYADEHLGLVILSDEPAFEFWLDHGELVAPDVPVVFGGVNVLEPNALANHPNITGVIEGMEIEKNLKLIARLQPEPGRLVLLGDETKLGQKMVARVKANQKAFEAMAGHRKIEVWDHFERFEDLYQQAERLQPNDAILLLAVHRDAQGHYWSNAKNLKILTEHSSAPVYSMWGIALGNGIVGGYVNDPYQHGQELGTLATKVLGGTPVSELPVVDKTIYAPTFDKAALKSHELKRRNLPKGSTFIQEPKVKTFAEQQPAWVGFALLAGLIFLYQARRLIDRNKQQERRVSRLSRENRRLTRDSKLYRNMAMTDELTGVPNRRAGSMHLDGLCEFAKQEQSFLGQAPSLAVAIVDIDRFKDVNDSLGHEVGDKVLWETAKTLQAQMRPHDDLCRWGGEEFLIVLRGMTPDTLPEVLDRLRMALQHAQIGKKLGVKNLTASFGAAMLGSDCKWRKALDRADKELYRAKTQGRNQVCVAHSDAPAERNDQSGAPSKSSAVSLSESMQQIA